MRMTRRAEQGKLGPTAGTSYERAGRGKLPLDPPGELMEDLRSLILGYASDLAIEFATCMTTPEGKR